MGKAIPPPPPVTGGIGPGKRMSCRTILGIGACAVSGLARRPTLLAGWTWQSSEKGSLRDLCVVVGASECLGIWAVLTDRH